MFQKSLTIIWDLGRELAEEIWLHMLYVQFCFDIMCIFFVVLLFASVKFCSVFSFDFNHNPSLLGFYIYINKYRIDLICSMPPM